MICNEAGKKLVHGSAPMIHEIQEYPSEHGPANKKALELTITKLS